MSDEYSNDEMYYVRIFRKWSLAIAEFIDAFRFAPRVILVMYGALVWYLVEWFIGIAAVEKVQCDQAILKLLLESNVDPAQASQIACKAIDVIGGPTPGQTAFVTAIVGLSTAIFGLYTKGGRDWEHPFNYWRKNESNQPSSRSIEPPKERKEGDCNCS